MSSTRQPYFSTKPLQCHARRVPSRGREGQEIIKLQLQLVLAALGASCEVKNKQCEIVISRRTSVVCLTCLDTLFNEATS